MSPNERADSSQFDYHSPQLEMVVQPLPLGEPGSFTGAVGSFRISASVDTARVEVGDPLTLTVNVTGEGNFAALPGPAWPEVSGWRAMAGDTAISTSVQDGRLSGTKTFKRVLVPERHGIHNLPPISYSFFDPRLGTYATESTDPIAVEVTGTWTAADSTSSPVRREESYREQDDLVMGNIRPPPLGLDRVRRPVVHSPLFWGAWSAPAAALLLVVTWRLVGRRRAKRDMAGGLDWPESARAEDLAPGAAAAALHRRLSAILGTPSNMMLAEDLIDAIRTEGISEDTADDVATVLRELDEVRFGPGDEADGAELGRAVAAIIRRLDYEQTS